jgi:epoxyqueuosine reductase QueG
LEKKKIKNSQKMTTEINSETVKKYGIAAGASVVGIAASKDFELAPDGFKPSDKLEGCLSVVVLGTPFPQESLSVSLSEYTEIRNGMLEKMDSVAKETAKQIKGKGYQTMAIGGVGGKYVNGKFYGHISLKHAAELAGLGVINRNYLLTNPEYGNLLWFSAVLTDAELVPDKKAQYTLCNNCNKCVETCPSKALENPGLFKHKECNKECWKMVNRKWELNCFLCRKVCPYCFGKID